MTSAPHNTEHDTNDAPARDEQRKDVITAGLSIMLNGWLASRGDIRIATAESLTGGGVGRVLTMVPGSSAYFVGGIIAYSNDAKASLLGVPQGVLDSPGAVSEPCARAMAEGARRAFDATFAVATTGIAGPDGATERKPLGLVYIAVAGPRGTAVREHRFPGDREAVTGAAVEAALRQLNAAVEDHLRD